MELILALASHSLPSDACELVKWHVGEFFCKHPPSDSFVEFIVLSSFFLFFSRFE